MTHGQKAFDKRYYRRFFDKYSKREFEKYVNWAFGWVRFLDRYLDIKIGEGKTLHELGSSLGYFSRVFKDRGFDVSGSDISSYIVKKAGLLQRDIEFFRLDVENNFAKKKYDYIIAFEVVEHLKNTEKAFKNIYKMLKPNGYFILSTPFPSVRAYADPTHVNIHRSSWWTKLGRRVGFRKTKVIYATFVPFLYRISRYLSVGFPFKSDIPYVNSTTFILLRR
jgi:2-polyprenyl-3-methyl-5-hydroxy-6-metoxy-1,4-benzoquinol methylase